MQGKVAIPEEIRTHRFPEFDSLRGLAALTVVLHHILGLWEGSQAQWWIRASPAAILVNGTSAVTVFFVLSGFVLTIPYKRKRAPVYGLYLLKRFCRIYLPYAGSLLLVLLTLKIVRTPVYMGNLQYDLTWNSGINWYLVKQHLGALGNFNVEAYNPPYWTLVLEMRMSLVMPVIAFLALRSRFFPGCCFALATNFAVWYLKPFFRHGMPLQIIDLGCLFYIGSLLAANFDSVATLYRQASHWIRRLLLVLAMIAYGGLGFRSLGIPPVGTMLLGFASLVMLLAASQNLKIRHFLHLPAVLRLGEISYSIYLVHMIVILAFVHTFWGRASLLPLVPVIIVATYLLAEAFHWAVELPAIRLGRHVERYFAPRSRLAAPATNFDIDTV